MVIGKIKKLIQPFMLVFSHPACIISSLNNKVVAIFLKQNILEEIFDSMNHLFRFRLFFIVIISSLFCCELDEGVENPFDPANGSSENNQNCKDLVFDYQAEMGCDGKMYNDPNTIEYLIPFPTGTTFKMGLGNCSSSYHAAGNPDQYAYDFDLPTNTIFTAAKPGKVVRVVEDQPSGGGGVGNYLVIDHEDGTFGLYYHSPQDGIIAEVGQEVDYGTALGKVGRSGLAGYPHLHFIVVKDGFRYPYNSIPVSFSNVTPPVVVLQSYETYVACE